jgi:hypothetical protein
MRATTPRPAWPFAILELQKRSCSRVHGFIVGFHNNDLGSGALVAEILWRVERRIDANRRAMPAADSPK